MSAITLPLLEVRDLTVEFSTRRGTVRAVQHVDIAVAKGETLGIVGESGSGKSVTSYAVMRILDRAGRIAEGSVTFTGLDVRAAGEDKMRDLRGREISMIFQNPRAALNPIRKVGHQIEDVLRQHAQAGSDDVTEKAVAVLEQVRIARPAERYHAYPFELSGGMCQRVVIALALACRPQLLIADEPTTGLDVTTQKAVMDLVVELTRERGMSTILITHDLGLAAAYCDRVVVMEKGRVVETAASKTIFTAPSHPYTRKLMRATPRPGVHLRDLLPEEEAAPPSPRLPSGSPHIRPAHDQPEGLRGEGRGEGQRQTPTSAPVAAPHPNPLPTEEWGEGIRRPKANGAQAPADAGNREPLLVVESLVKEYPRKDTGRSFSFSGLFKRNGSSGAAPAEAQAFRAVDGISFAVHKGESVGLVGESGCGKSTTSTIVMRLIDATDGRILFDGQDIGTIPAKRFARLPLRKRIQMVFQDPTDSLNPRFTAARAIADPILRLGRRQGPQGRAGALRGAGAPGGAAGRAARPLSPSALGRAEGARRHCPGDLAQPRPGHIGRADRGARCFRAGGGAQPPAGAQGAARHELPVRLARPQRGAAAVRPRHRHACGPDRGGGADGARAVRPRGRLYARPAGGHSASAGMTNTVVLSSRNFASAKYPGPRVAGERVGKLRSWVPALRAGRSGRDDNRGDEWRLP